MISRTQPSCLLSSTNPPRVHTPLAPQSTPLPPAGTKTSRQPEKHSEAAAEEGKVHYRARHLCLAAAKQPPCVPAAVGAIATEDGTEGRKELSATGSECQAGAWALGQSRPIHRVIRGAASFTGRLPHRLLSFDFQGPVSISLKVQCGTYHPVFKSVTQS